MCRRGARVLQLGSALLMMLLIGCSTPDEPAAAPTALPDANTLTGWTPVDAEEIFDSENLYDLVDGQAEAFFAYGFEQVTVQQYENSNGEQIGVEIWRLTSPVDAFGLFTNNVSGTPADVGNDADSDPGHRLAFWQNRYYVRLRTLKTIHDSDLVSLAAAVSAALPSGGERPALLDRLPPQGMVPRSTIFFHQELSIQDQVWLGGENLLGLGPETDGILAQYNVDGKGVHLLLVQYRDPRAASDGLAALIGSQDIEVVVADIYDTLLGAVFGEISVSAGDNLLAAALGDEG